MRSLVVVRVAVLSLLVAAGSSAAAHARGPADELRIAVAANFKLTLDRLIAAFGIDHDATVTVTTGASGLLYGQIVQGAPFDLFFSADAARPQRLESQGLVVPGTRFVYATGRLALWRPGRPWTGTIEEVLRDGDVDVLAIANPATAPYGQAALEVLEHFDLAGAVSFRVVRGESLGQAFQFVASGNAELGFVALSQLIEYDAQTGHDARAEALVVDSTLHRPIVQEAVWLARARGHALAGQFLAFVRSDAGRAIIVAAGYAVPDGS